MSDQEQSGKPDWAMSRRERQAADAIRQGLTPPKRRRWPWLILVLVLIGVAAFVLMRGDQAPAETDEAEADAATVFQLSSAEVSTAETGNLEQLIRVTGTLSPVETTQVASRVNAPVANVAVRAGDSVEAGDQVVEMDAEDLTNQLNQQRASLGATEAELALARSQLTRDSALAERGLTPASSIESQRAQVEALAANLEAQQWSLRIAERAVENATVEAPVSGVVAERLVNSGQYVSTGTPLLSIVDLSSIELAANVPLRDIDRIRPGQTTRVRVDGIAAAFDGQVDRINPTARDGTRSAPVYITVPNPDSRLRGGMFASVEIVVDRVADALAVPEDALREDAEGNYLLLLEDGQLRRADVTTGSAWNGGRLVRILDGLAPGDRYLSAPLPELRAGDAVALESD